MTDDNPKLCYGCKHLTTKIWGDGSMDYGCALTPGLVTGGSSAFDGVDDPVACEKYEEAKT